MAIKLGSSNKRVVIADDSGLIYSDDWRNGWTQGFKAIGCDVKVVDVKPLRRAMQMIRSPYRTMAMPGTAKQMARDIAKFKPALVWCHHGRAASNPEFLNELHRNGIQTAVYLCDEPYEIGETARYSPLFKHVFSMDLCTVEAHRHSRPSRKNVHYMPSCADTTLFPYVDYKNRNTPAFFLGNATLTPRPRWLKPVEKTVEGADIRFFTTVGKRDAKWVTAADHPKLYADCVVGLNVHRDPSITQDCFKKRVLGRGSAMKWPAGLTKPTSRPKEWGTGFWNDGNLPASHINPRFMEMAASGTLVVSDDHRSELARMFPMAPRAQDPEHFLELVHYYLAHEDEAEAIGKACSYLISKRHTYAHRAAEVLIRCGLRESLPADLHSSLGEREDWLTPPASTLLAARSSSARTGPSERWNPQSGMSLTRTSGKVSDTTSLDAPTPWLS
jgi:hypothetical protein